MITFGDIKPILVIIFGILGYALDGHIPIGIDFYILLFLVHMVLLLMAIVLTMNHNYIDTERKGVYNRMGAILVILFLVYILFGLTDETKKDYITSCPPFMRILVFSMLCVDAIKGIHDLRLDDDVFDINAVTVL